jgi:hypothetical protein
MYWARGLTLIYILHSVEQNNVELCKRNNKFLIPLSPLHSQKTHPVVILANRFKRTTSQMPTTKQNTTIHTWIFKRFPEEYDIAVHYNENN